MKNWAQNLFCGYLGQYLNISNNDLFKTIGGDCSTSGSHFPCSANGQVSEKRIWEIRNRIKETGYLKWVKICQIRNMNY